MIFLLTFNTPEEEAIFEQLYRDYAGFMLRVARHRLSGAGLSADAEDVVHDAFLYIADHLKTIHLSDRIKTRAYLALISDHKAIDRIRQAKPAESIDAVAEQLTSPVHSAYEETLADALEALPTEYREILSLHYYYGYRYREIAELLGQSPRAVYKKAAHARKELALMLKGKEESRDEQNYQH